VRAGLRDVLRPQPPVEVDLCVQALEVRVLGFAEAGHEPAVYEQRRIGTFGTASKAWPSEVTDLLG
jgi:hypothetical protein